MPIHDWTRVDAGLFHHFHHDWTTTLCSALKAGGLPLDERRIREMLGQISAVFDREHGAFGGMTYQGRSLDEGKETAHVHISHDVVPLHGRAPWSRRGTHHPHPSGDLLTITGGRRHSAEILSSPAGGDEIDKRIDSSR